MQELNFIQSVQERDIDLMLLEECHTSMAFCNWLVSRVYEFPHTVEFVGAWHSVIHNQYGESDLVVIFNDNDGSHQAILIENKIDATPQQQRVKVSLPWRAWDRTGLLGRFSHLSVGSAKIPGIQQ
ncbi:hypothetical protein [Shewanella algae]|uniref:hypothetical protein n=1 Tax=Shewanella algae TaxID=38313 RepID=UPI000B8A6AEF|nr:hypothetical protein [Shewanella algae]